MGVDISEQQEINTGLRQYTEMLLKDLKALEQMLDEDTIESGVTRIGAEQELCLINPQGNAAPLAVDILARIDDPHVVHEFALFNLEINLDPLPFKGNCFSRMEAQLTDLLNLIRDQAQRLGADICLAGILPTLRQRDLNFANMTPLERYHRLNENLKRGRDGKHFYFRIHGNDELKTRHPSALLESCNTSFQIHLQVSPDQFPDLYNFSQLVSAPLLAAGTNSHLLFGKRLWKETRIALFQQAIDTRNHAQTIREESPRVTFGNAWVRNSVTEIFKDDLARFRLLIHDHVEEDALAILAAKQIPKLKALSLFNGTVYRWNRACYGISEGKPHLRIENRILPAGPSIKDEMANTAFWLGMMVGMPDHYRNLPERIPFHHAQANFLTAARSGLESEFHWLDKSVISARDLILQELLPMARKGLEQAGIDASDAVSLLDIVEARVTQRKTGSDWALTSFNDISKKGTRYEAAVALTTTMARNQWGDGKPVHLWEPADLNSAETLSDKFFIVEQIMSTELYTMGETDLVDLAIHVMDWKHIRHIPVENQKGQLVGLLNARTLMKHLSTAPEEVKTWPVTRVMIADPITVKPESSTLDALAIMQKNRISCLPVVEKGKLVGVVTEYDFTRVTADLLKTLSGKTWTAIENQNP